jgi:replicative DNA helicase
VPAHPVIKDDKRGKYLRSANFTREDFANIREEILKLAGTQETVNAHDVYKHLRKATPYTAVKKAQIYWQLTTLFNEKKLERAEEGSYALPK